ncbi:MAG: transposase [Wolbachia sp.]|nr:transposase [Wolbachia sp.]MDD9336192.1 transposase [Wolbachia sp.]
MLISNILLKVTESLGKKVLKELLPEYDGTVVSDRYASYNYFNCKNREIYLVHLARDFERFANSKMLKLAELAMH